MGLHFQETMTGKLETLAGVKQFSFTVSADSPTFLALGGWAPLKLTGRATLEGVVADTALLPGSTLEIGIPFHRYLRYTVFFADQDGHIYRFFGQKTVMLRNIPRTMTTLEGHLFMDGAKMGPAVLRFPLRDLGRFLASFRPWEKAGLREAA